MLANARPPPGFVRGTGSSSGNNCLISSVVQALAGVADETQQHRDLCADIRLRGAGWLWHARKFIEASESALAFISDCVSDPDCPIVHMTLHSGHDGGNRQEVRAEGAARAGPPRVVHLYNPGVCISIHCFPCHEAPRCALAQSWLWIRDDEF